MSLTPPPSTRLRPFGLVVAAASVPMFMATLDNLVMTNALPVLHDRLGASVEELQWFVNAYTLSFASMILVASALGDRFGRRTVFMIGIAIFGVGSVLAALSTDPGQLIAARAVQGFGAAGVLPLSLALISGGVAPERRPLAIGIWGGVSGLGVALGPLIGGAVMEGWNWQAIFWINVPVALIAIPLAYVVLNNDFGQRSRIDIVGAVLAGVGVLALVHTIVRGNDDGWGSIGVIVEGIAAIALLIVFVLWQTRVRAPLVPLRLFGDRSFSVTNIVGFAFSFGTFGAVFILIQYMQVVQGSTPFEAAVQTTPWTLAPMFIAPLAGVIAPRVGTRVLMVAGLGLQAVALFWIAVTMSTDLPYAQLVAPFIMAGVGMGLVFAPSATALLATLGIVDHAKASGVNSTVREIGLALGTAAMTAIFLGAGGELRPDLYVDAARPAVLVGAAVLVVGMIAALWLPAGRSSTVAPEVDAVPDAEGAASDCSELARALTTLAHHEARWPHRAPRDAPLLVPDRLIGLVHRAVGPEDEEPVERAGEPAVVRDGEHGPLEPRESRLRALRPRRGRGCRSARRAAAGSCPTARAAGSGTAPAARPTASRSSAAPGRRARSGPGPSSRHPSACPAGSRRPGAAVRAACGRRTRDAGGSGRTSRARRGHPGCRGPCARPARASRPQS